jgi:cytochrome bd-I ubiquinol oxidase subunit X
MWYFAWVLGVCFAASFAVLNAMWLESSCETEGNDRGEGV